MTDQIFTPILSWDLSISDTALRYSNGNRTAHRPGNVSCYPAALAPVVGPKCTMAIVLEECPFANNTISFGIAVRGFPKSGQQAIGERSDSWGIFNNRSEASSGDTSKVCCFDSNEYISSFIISIYIITFYKLGLC